MGSHEHEKGSYTIEAAMIFTTVILSIVTLMLTFLYMQQKTCIVSAAAYAAQQGANLWVGTGKVNIDKAEDMAGYRIFDNLLMSEKVYEGYARRSKTSDGEHYILLMDTDDSLSGEKAKLIGEALCGKLDSAVLKPEYTKVRISFSNNLLSGKLSVEVNQEIKVPLGDINRFFSGKETFTLSCKTTTAITEPDEYIRNIDLAVELAKRMEDKLDIGEAQDAIGIGRGSDASQ